MRRRESIRQRLMEIVGLILMLAIAGGAAAPLAAQQDGKIATPTVSTGLSGTTETTIDFPVGIRFTAELRVPENVSELDLLYQAGDDETWNLIRVPSADIEERDAQAISVDFLMNFQSSFVPLGLTITYRWQTVSPIGRAASSQETTDWFDDRQDWTTIESEQVQLHYFGLEPDFARESLASAQQTITSLEQRYSLQRSRTLTIWVYPDQASFKGSLPANSRESIAGGSYIGYSLIVAVIPPGSVSEIGRVIPHEASHQVLFQATRNSFTILPVWFDEGMATHVQSGGTGMYMGMVIAAEKNDALFDLSSLSASFPFVPSQATLAYAASWSAIEYIEQTYGERGLAAMIAAYRSGLPYDDAIQSALGISIDQLNHDWKVWIATYSTE